MSKLLPVRHPNKDFFIVDIADASPRDDLASMEHPVFSLSVKPDMRELDYETSGGKRLRVIPSGRGLATILDKDIILYCISKLVHEKNIGREISPWVEVSAHEVMVATNWNTENKSYKRFENALVRLKGTVIITDIETGDTLQTQGFGLIDAFEIDRKDKDGKKGPFGRLSKVRIKLSDWTFRAVEAMEVLSINPQYFRLRGPLERRLYEIARKHVGTKNQSWSIHIEKLQKKVGTNAPLKKFRFNLRRIINSGNIPDYGFMLQGDKVVMQKLIDDNSLIKSENFIPLRPDTLDKAQKIAAQIGISVFDLEREWNEWVQGKNKTPDNPDGAFIGFCKKKAASPEAQRVIAARQQANEAQQLGFSLQD
ncbi:MAG: replication initiator protein A [Pseudomonadota bacterium]